MITFGVLVPCHDHGHYLAQALGSVLRQSYPHWRCVIVDDGSTDDSYGVAHVFREKDRRFAVVRCLTNRGMGPASAVGMTHFLRAPVNVDVTHVATLDADDLLEDDALEVMARHWSHHAFSGASMLYSSHQLVAPDLSPLPDRWQSAPVPPGWSRLRGYREGGMPDESGVMRQVTVGPLRTFSVDAYRKTSGYGPWPASQDFDITGKLEEVGLLVHVPRLLYRYRFDAAAHARHPNVMADIAAEAGRRRAGVVACCAACTRPGERARGDRTDGAELPCSRCGAPTGGRVVP